MAVAYQPMKAARVKGGYDIPMESLPEKATQTYKLGALVQFSTGFVEELASSDPTTALIIGVACQAGQNLTTAGVSNGGLPYTSPNTLIAIAGPATIFEANLDDTTQTLALTQAMVGLQYAVEKDSASGLWFIDESDTTNKAVTVIALKDPVGTVNGRVYFTFRDAVTALFG